MLHWSNYSAKAVARIQARGMPIDMPLWNLVQENKAAVIGALLRQFDPSYGSEDPIYTPGRRMELRPASNVGSSSVGVHGMAAAGEWPASIIDSDAFRLMYHVPGIEGLHALRDSLGFIVRARLPIGRDGRNRPSLFPFCTATGRNAHAKSLYNAHAGMRSFMVFPRHDHGLPRLADPRGRDCCRPLRRPSLHGRLLQWRCVSRACLLCGFTSDRDPKRWKKDNPDMRQRMKPLQLAINYGMGVPSLAQGLNRHPLIASAIIERHRQTYPRFWQWREDVVQTAMLDRRIETVFGWPLRLSTQPQRAHALQFPDARKRRRDAAVGGVATVRGRHQSRACWSTMASCSR